MGGYLVSVVVCVCVMFFSPEPPKDLVLFFLSFPLGDWLW